MAFVPAFILSATIAATTVPVGQITGTTHIVRPLEVRADFGGAVEAVKTDAFMICRHCGADQLAAPAKVAPVPVLISAKTGSEEALPLIKNAEREESREARIGTILFRFDRAALSTEARRQLSLLPKTTGPLDIVGYACDLGPAEYNKRLSLRRARATAHYLEALGFTIGTVEGRGEAPAKDGVRSGSRRVDINAINSKGE